MVPADTVDETLTLLEEWRATNDVPGLGVALVNREGVVHASGLGERERESGAPVTSETLFAVGSVAKPVTALAVLQLVDRSALGLDDHIATYVDPLADAPGDPITIHDLLSHSSGMPRDFVASFRVADEDERRLHDYIDDAADQRLTDRPRYMYYNSGYFLLADIVEAVGGRPFPEYVREEVFDPLGMRRAGYGPDALDAADAATGYRRTDEGLEPAPVDHDAGASGGLVCSVTDLAALVRCVLNDGEYEGTRLLSRDLVDEMCRYQSPPLPSDGDTHHGYGYGWELSQFLDETLVSHRGGLGISGGYVGLLRDRGLGVVLAYNALGQPTIPYGEATLALAAGEDPRGAVPLLDVYEAVDAATGTYTADEDAMTATVEPGPAGTLTVSLSMGAEFTVTPEAVAEEPYVFALPMGGGVKWVAEFHDGADTLVVSTGKWTTRLSAEG